MAWPAISASAVKKKPHVRVMQSEPERSLFPSRTNDHGDVMNEQLKDSHGIERASAFHSAVRRNDASPKKNLTVASQEFEPEPKPEKQFLE